jgi:ABC-type Fe3+-hydroxamate transport system substrate-binding protein
MALSLTVAGAAEAFHLFPEHLAACRYHKTMQGIAGLILIAAAQLAVQDDYGNTVQLKAPAQRIVSLSPH